VPISGCQRSASPSSGSSASTPVTCTSASCTSSPTYSPGLWNNPPVINSTNCYAYAANDPSGHPVPGKPQPGVQCGSPCTGVSCAEVSRAASCDGMMAAPNPPPARTGYYPVALVVDPGVDYHWYRLDSNGRWSHKPGNTAATDLDASGAQITNPETADRDYGSVNYSQFCGYFYVPTGGIRTAP